MVGHGAFQAEDTESSKWGNLKELSVVHVALCGKVEERVGRKGHISFYDVFVSLLS